MSIAHQPDYGELQLRIICAGNLKHPGGFRLSLSTHASVSTSQYVRLLRETELMTPKGNPRTASAAGENPRWDQTFEFGIMDALAPIFIGVSDDEGVLIGQVQLPVYQIRNQAQSIWLPLCSKLKYAHLPPFLCHFQHGTHYH